MVVNNKNSKILHCINKCTPFYIIQIDGIRYFSSGYVFVEDTKENIAELIKKNYISKTMLESLYKAPGVEWDDLEDGLHLFSFSDIEEFTIDLPNLRSGYYMFFNSSVKKFKSYTPKIKYGSYMFYGSCVKDFEIDMPNLEDDIHMFSITNKGTKK